MNIKTENINVVIDNNNILKDINIEVDNKEVIGIIGPNGSGKSTLLKCIYRLLKPNAGLVKFDDVDIKNISIKESSKKVAVLSQHNNYDFDFTVKDIVLMGRSPHKKFMERDNKNDYDLVNDALRKVDMINFKDRSFQSLSGGEQQRVILARALAQQPKCLILDEPTNHLDIKYQLEILNILKELNRKENRTIVMVIHDINHALRYADNIIALKDGNIFAQGSKDKIINEDLIKNVFDIKCRIIDSPIDNSKMCVTYI